MCIVTIQNVLVFQDFTLVLSSTEKKGGKMRLLIMKLVSFVFLTDCTNDYVIKQNYCTATCTSPHYIEASDTVAMTYATCSANVTKKIH